jgi:hypothetical protein
MAYDVFISYASEDKIVADAACGMLESNGVRCWIAPRDVIPGMAYGEAIIDAIRSCRIMILVFSSKSNASPHIPKEIERAVSAGVAVIPFRIEDVKPGRSLDYFIGNVHWLDALTPPLERHLERLVRNVQTLLSRDVPVIEPKLSSASEVPASPAASRPVQSVPASAQTHGGRAPWLYAALAIVAVVAVVFAALFFSRKPSITAQVTPAPASVTPPAATQPPAAEAPQKSGTPSADNSAAPVQAKPVAATPPALQKEAPAGVHDSARVPRQPAAPATPHTAPPTSGAQLYDQALSSYDSGEFPQAAKLYQKACDGGDRRACTNLGMMYENGNGVEKSPDRAADLFKRSCEAGGSGGCLNLGLLYLNGEGVPKDPNRAAELFNRSCDEGSGGGCTNLGLMYAKGENVPRDMKRAAGLYTRACDDGHAVGCNDLGLMYERGRVLDKDLNRAAELFKKACDAKLELGCTNLSRLKDRPRNR